MMIPLLLMAAALSASSWVKATSLETTLTLISSVLMLVLFWKILISPNNVLSAILSLEIFMLVTLALMVFTHFPSNSYLFLVFFTLAVAEASAGLGVVIKNIRTFETLY